MRSTLKESVYNLIIKLPLGKCLFSMRHKIKQRKIKKENLSYAKMLDEYQNLPIKDAYVYCSMLLNEKTFYRALIIKNNEKYQKYSTVPVKEATVLEIGSGRFLAAPMGLALFGFKKIITIDAYRLAVPEFIEKVYHNCRLNHRYLGIKKNHKLKDKITVDNLDEVLLKNFNIDYRAPYDYSNINLPNNSVDYVISNNAFEYINQTNLSNIVQGVFRVLRSGGIFYITINFKDHYSMDNLVTIYDYLQYSTEDWRERMKQEDVTFLQNRLRTVDYVNMFAEAGFEILKLVKYEVTDEDRAAFATIKVADEFRQKYTDEELMEKGGYFVLRKPISKSRAENQGAPSVN